MKRRSLLPRYDVSAMIDMAPTALFGIDAGGNFIFMNTFMRRLFRAPQTETDDAVCGGHLKDLFVNAESAQQYLLSVLDAQDFQAQEPILRDELAVRCDKSQFMAEFSLMRLGEGPSSILVGIVKDISDRMEALAAIQLRQVAIESAANGIVIVDRDGTIEWVNPAFTKMTGYSLEEACGNTPRVLRSGLHSQAFYADLWQTILSGKPWQGEMNNRRKDGTLYVEDMTITPVGNETGEISHFIAVKNDITERKSLEKLEEEMVDAVVHDLRNPLGNILLSLDMFEASTPIQKNMLQIARKSARCMKDMVNSILDYKRMEAGHLPLHLEAVPVENLFDPIIELQRPLAAENGLSLVGEIDPRLPPLHVDAHLILRVLQNLVDNAIKYSPTGAEIRLTASLDTETGDHVIIGVHDQGEGIPDSVREHLFEKFFTVQGSAQRRGTGFGLAFCRLAVEAHGGKIGVTSIIGRGASFYLQLPLYETLPLALNLRESMVVPQF